MEEYRALEKRIIKRWDAEIQEELEEDELDLEMLGRRFMKEKRERKKSVKKEK